MTTVFSYSTTFSRDYSSDIRLSSSGAALQNKARDSSQTISQVFFGALSAPSAEESPQLMMAFSEGGWLSPLEVSEIDPECEEEFESENGEEELEELDLDSESQEVESQSCDAGSENNDGDSPEWEFSSFESES